MTAQVIKGYLEATLRRCGFSYAEEGGYLTLTAGLGGKRWKMALSCGENRLIFYAAYPWQTAYEHRERVLEHLNALNAVSGFGSYFLLDTESGALTVFRCDVLIADEYSVIESIEKGFKYASAAVCARWETLKENI